jgi:hypothetical protein
MGLIPIMPLFKKLLLKPENNFEEGKLAFNEFMEIVTYFFHVVSYEKVNFYHINEFFKAFF